MQVDVYDLRQIKDQEAGDNGLMNFFKEMKSIGIATDSTKRLITTQDWFLSKLYIDLLWKFYEKRG